MASWDPMAEPLETSQTGESTGVDAIWDINDARFKITQRDHVRLHVDLLRKCAKAVPWQSTPDPCPDLTWHKPTCSFEDWKHKDVKVELGAGIAYIRLNRPDDGNTLSDGVIAGLCDALFILHARSDIRVAVFTGEGKMFCAGMDPKGDPFGFRVKTTAEARKTTEADGQDALACGVFPDGEVNIGKLFQANFWHVWASLPQFTICLANGSALGDGMGCLCCCDMVIALKTSFFGFEDSKFGMVNAIISPYVLARVGAGTAKKMFLLGKILSAEAALEKKLVNKVVESLAEANNLIKETCAELTKCGPKSVDMAKQLIMGVAGNQISEPIIFYTLSMHANAIASDEAKQACSAKKAKPWELKPIA